MLADPFGHGFCLLQFNRQGYDALLRLRAAVFLSARHGEQRLGAAGQRRM